MKCLNQCTELYTLISPGTDRSKSERQISGTFKGNTLRLFSHAIDPVVFVAVVGNSAHWLWEQRPRHVLNAHGLKRQSTARLVSIIYASALLQAQLR